MSHIPHGEARGFFAIGITNTKTPQNIGTLWRSAHLFGASMIFTVQERYKRQAADTMATPMHTPLMHFTDIDDLIEHLPNSCPLVGVELDDRSVALPDYHHRPRAAYLLGAEDHGLTPAQIDRCHDLIQIPSLCHTSMNVSVAGSIVMYDRMIKGTIARKGS